MEDKKSPTTKRSSDNPWRKTLLWFLGAYLLFSAVFRIAGGYSDLGEYTDPNGVGARAKRVDADIEAATKAREHEAYFLRDLVWNDGVYITAYYPELFVIRLDDTYLHIDPQTYKALLVVAQRTGRREINCVAAFRYMQELEEVRVSGR